MAQGRTARLHSTSVATAPVSVARENSHTHACRKKHRGYVKWCEMMKLDKITHHSTHGSHLIEAHD